MSLFKGAGVAIVTPFDADNKINFTKLRELIDWQISEKTDAIIICGTTGEAPTLRDDEHMEAIKFAVEAVAGRVPVIAGTGSNDTQHAIEMSQYAESVGVDGLLLVTPYYNKATQSGLIRHFNAIADSVNIPIILYSVPGRTSVNIDPQTVLALSKHPNIQGIKEASGNIAQVVEIARLIPEDFYLYSGNDDMIVPLMSVGGDGVISVLSNIMPRETHDMVMHYLDGDFAKSLELQLGLKPLIDALFCEVNPIPVKTALNLMGKEVGPLRGPLYEMEPKNVERLERELKAAGLL
ncbi:4-hydroxy-tetrahydrodipicolinate synthase [Acidaminobacter sp.]|uniref:4-hydroxy-tetrahydrodipicolinate synthase n=1 Tax=Acidaminobacter sp. TaxID=1872102 RepID=UPI00137EDBB4|nr:4-hydroxy-tetrahydrodipicolinate synthase [Acidaminobacter sp.]MDK9710306.1 4-hydroxy-tetrahydrodipicolinate synthase [Acidaminobacter sp.]MZQ97971.1 4-hydroxy-tetrahydrodipicolinate synthase [Acidaminobacter sp.]